MYFRHTKQFPLTAVPTRLPAIICFVVGGRVVDPSFISRSRSLGFSFWRARGDARCSLFHAARFTHIMSLNLRIATSSVRAGRSERFCSPRAWFFSACCVWMQFLCQRCMSTTDIPSSVVTSLNQQSFVGQHRSRPNKLCR